MTGVNWFTPTAWMRRLTAWCVSDNILPRLEDLPIPRDVKVDPRWPKVLAEIAAHVGPYYALSICAHFGGQEVYVARDPQRNAFGRVVNARAATILSEVFGGETLILPIARWAIAKARRASVCAAVRAGILSAGDGAQIAGMRRDNFSRLMNKTDEGVGVEPLELATIRHRGPLSEAAAVAEEVLLAADADEALIEEVRDSILSIGQGDAAMALSAATADDVATWLRRGEAWLAIDDEDVTELGLAYAWMSLSARAGSSVALARLRELAPRIGMQVRSLALRRARDAIAGGPPLPIAPSHLAETQPERIDHA